VDQLTPKASWCFPLDQSKSSATWSELLLKWPALQSRFTNDLVLSLSGYFNVEADCNRRPLQTTIRFQVAEDFDWSKGKHQLAFGVNWVHSQLNELSTFQSNGQFTFGGSSGLGSTGDGLARLHTGRSQPV